MNAFLYGCLFGLALAGVVFTGWAVLVVAKRADEASESMWSEEFGDEEPAVELAELRHRLAICQEMAETQRQRADTYYDLFCAGAKANADLRRELS